MKIIDIEKAIIAQLKTKISGIAIEGMPDIKSLETLAAKYPNGAIMVLYAGSTFGETTNVNKVWQSRDTEFVISIYARSLRPVSVHAGIYEYMEMVLAALTGFKPAECGHMIPISDGLEEKGESLWRFDIHFRMKKQHKQSI